MDKMMTFKEWDNETFVRNIAKFDEDQRKACFNAARQGMIPESEAVRIPEIKEWAEDGSGKKATAFVVTGFFTWVTSNLPWKQGL